MVLDNLIGPITYTQGRMGTEPPRVCRRRCGLNSRALAERNAVTLVFCRVGGDVASPAPHRPGRADFPHPVFHAQASLTEQHIGGRSSPIQSRDGPER